MENKEIEEALIFLQDNIKDLQNPVYYDDNTVYKSFRFNVDAVNDTPNIQEENNQHSFGYFHCNQCYYSIHLQMHSHNLQLK